MVTGIEAEIIEAIKDDTIYDFIANNWHRMSHETQRRLALELAFEIFEGSPFEAEERQQNVVDELTEWWSE